MNERLVGIEASAEHGGMRPRRFKAEGLDGDVITLSGAEARHAETVLRLGTGDEVILFDGAGNEANGRIVESGPGELRIRVVARRVIVMRHGSLSMVVATPKGERADWMMEKCAELGIQAMVPLICERGQVIPGDGKLARWRRKAEAAAKQSGRAETMRVEEPVDLQAALHSSEPGTMILFGDPREGTATTLMMLAQAAGDARLVMFIGPEGGFTDHEVRAMEQAGATPVRLAESILRIETAAVAFASVWAAWRADIARE